MSARGRHTVESILAAAEERLVAAPYDDFNTNLVAERAGVSVGSLYQYFESKEAIVAELRLRSARRLQAALAAALERASGETPERVIRRLVRAHLEAIAENAELHALLASELCDVGVAPDFETRAALAAAIDGGEAGVRRALQRLAADAYGDLDAWPILLGAWGLLRVMTTIALIDGPLDVEKERLEEEICEAILHFVERRLSARGRETESQM